MRKFHKLKPDFIFLVDQKFGQFDFLVKKKNSLELLMLGLQKKTIKDGFFS